MALSSGMAKHLAMYADDIALVANSPNSMQAMLDIVHGYAKKWRYQLNSVKSVAMVIGESSAARTLREGVIIGYGI